MKMLKLLDRISLAGMALGVGCILQPWWPAGFRLGFVATGLFTLLYIAVSHTGKAGSP